MKYAERAKEILDIVRKAAEENGRSVNSEIYQRVMELAQIAHPKFREELIEVARNRHYIFKDQLPPTTDGA